MGRPDRPKCVISSAWASHSPHRQVSTYRQPTNLGSGLAHWAVRAGSNITPPVPPTLGS